MQSSGKRKRESVWDYPRPPRTEQSSKRIRVIFNDKTIAETSRALRVLETSHPPVYYIPPHDVQQQCQQHHKTHIGENRDTSGEDRQSRVLGVTWQGAQIQS